MGEHEMTDAVEKRQLQRRLQGQVIAGMVEGLWLFIHCGSVAAGAAMLCVLSLVDAEHASFAQFVGVIQSPIFFGLWLGFFALVSGGHLAVRHQDLRRMQATAAQAIEIGKQSEAQHPPR